MDDTRIFILRIRVIGREGETAIILNEAMERMRKPDYAQKYRDSRENIHIIVLAIDREMARPAAVKVETA